MRENDDSNNDERVQMNVVEGRRCVFVCRVCRVLQKPMFVSILGEGVSEDWHEREPVEMRTFGSLLSSLVPSLLSRCTGSSS